MTSMKKYASYLAAAVLLIAFSWAFVQHVFFTPVEISPEQFCGEPDLGGFRPLVKNAEHCRIRMIEIHEPVFFCRITVKTETSDALIRESGLLPVENARKPECVAEFNRCADRCHAAEAERADGKSEIYADRSLKKHYDAIMIRRRLSDRRDELFLAIRTL